MKFSKGRKVEHVRYGEVEMLEEYPASTDGRFKGGITVKVLTEEGRSLFSSDRGGELPRCFEGNLNNLKPRKI